MNAGGIVLLSILTFGLALWLTGLFSSAASKWGFLDHPNERSLHDRSVPRTGGIAILISILLGGGAIFLWIFRQDTIDSPILWVPGGTFLIAVVSLWEDKVGLPVGLRFSMHGFASAAVIWGADLSLRTLAWPHLGASSLGVLSFPVTLFFLMWMTNLYNFMDGMDGFAGGMTVLGCGFLTYIAWNAGGDYFAALCLVIAAAAGGFLFYNLPPARIFMGDAGSIPLGFLVGTLSLIGVRHRLFDFWVPVLIFSPFVADATLTLFWRLLRGAKVWQAHREHYYQRLVLAGWGHKRTVLAEYILMLGCGASAILYIRFNETGRLIILFAWVLIYSMIALGIRRVELQSRTKGFGLGHETGGIRGENRYIKKV